MGARRWTVLETQLMWTCRTVALAATLAALTACASAPDETDADRAVWELGYTGEYQISSVSQSCDPGDPAQWRFSVATDGWAEALDLHITETGALARREDTEDPPSEVHEMSNVDYDAAGAWDEWYLSLVVVAEEADQQSGATTRWGCDAAPTSGMGGALAWMALMSPANAPSESVCAMWGYRAAEWYNDTRGHGCVCVDVDGDCTN